MSKQFLIFLAFGLVIVAGGLFILFSTTAGAHLRLDGKILKVRVMPIPGVDAALVFVDFRVNNPSDVRFVTSNVKMQLTSASGEKMEGTMVSKPEVDNIFQYDKLLGPKYNDVLSLQDRINPHANMDRMAGARFEVSETGIENRKDLRLELEDENGALAEVAEATKK